MRLLNFKSEGELRLGVSTENGVVNVAKAREELEGFAESPFTMRQLLDGGVAVRRTFTGLVEAATRKDGPWILHEGALEWAPCVPDPEKILCVGLNYRRHAAESGLSVPETPVLFSKFANSLAAHGDRVALPPVAREYDYEVELGVVIGRTARNVAEEEALDYVFGYCNANDLSARDLQTRTSQWLLGKSLDRFLPVGPYLVTADEVPDPQRMRLQCRLNGKIRQDSNTSDMIFSVSQIVSYVSRYMTLKPGDLISTGTPEGVILGMEEKVWLKPGDEIEVEVEGLGVLRNFLVVEGS